MSFLKLNRNSSLKYILKEYIECIMDEELCGMEDMLIFDKDTINYIRAHIDPLWIFVTLKEELKIKNNALKFLDIFKDNVSLDDYLCSDTKIYKNLYIMQMLDLKKISRKEFKNNTYLEILKFLYCNLNTNTYFYNQNKKIYVKNFLFEEIHDFQFYYRGKTHIIIKENIIQYKDMLEDKINSFAYNSFLTTKHNLYFWFNGGLELLKDSQGNEELYWIPKECFNIDFLQNSRYVECTEPKYFLEAENIKNNKTCGIKLSMDDLEKIFNEELFDYAGFDVFQFGKNNKLNLKV